MTWERGDTSLGCLPPAYSGDTCALLFSQVLKSPPTPPPPQVLALPFPTFPACGLMFSYLLLHSESPQNSGPKSVAIITAREAWVRSLEMLSSGVTHAAAFVWEFDRGLDWP